MAQCAAAHPPATGKWKRRRCTNTATWFLPGFERVLCDECYEDLAVKYFSSSLDARPIEQHIFDGLNARP